MTAIDHAYHDKIAGIAHGSIDDALKSLRYLFITRKSVARAVSESVDESLRRAGMEAIQMIEGEIKKVLYL